ncbi:MAG: hypothetical protein KKC80_02425 [Candidatus Margulisbacteria bacterium]|nr:hypothetical protein [Candidatus Margulisiibacteriota bacterium]MBU1617330.1 hypothetical protein [Candidatus Margulisiibacteriota bacterium]
MTSIATIRYDSSYHLHIIKPQDQDDSGIKTQELASQHRTTVTELERLNPALAQLKEGDLLVTPILRGV